MGWKISKKAKLRSTTKTSKRELILVKGVTPRTKIKTLEKRFKGEFRTSNLKKGTAVLFREKKITKRKTARK